MERRKDHKLSPSAEEFSIANSCWMGKSQFSLGMWVQVAIHAPIDRPTLMHIQVALSGLSED